MREKSTNISFSVRWYHEYESFFYKNNSSVRKIGRIVFDNSSYVRLVRTYRPRTTNNNKKKRSQKKKKKKRTRKSRIRNIAKKWFVEIDNKTLIRDSNYLIRDFIIFDFYITNRVNVNEWSHTRLNNPIAYARPDKQNKTKTNISKLFIYLFIF